MKTKIQTKLFEYQDKEYALFQSRLTPGIEIERFIGVRVPNVRLIAKEIKNEEYVKEFIKTLPHYYYDENMLHGLLISGYKDYDEIIKLLDTFLPYVDNWAVCDIMSPKALAKHKDKLLIDIKRWLKSNHTYTIRFAIEMLMSFYLEKDFKEEYLELVYKIRSNEYYVNMMKAWFMATALTKQYEATIKVIESKLLDDWSHNKSIQKAIESYRITNNQKEYLRTLKV